MPYHPRMHPADPDDPKVALVVAAAARAGVTIEPVVFDRDTRTSAEAAAAIGCDLAQICKSLVFQAGERPVLLLLSGADRVDLAKAAHVVGVDHLDRASADDAKNATGFTIGATPPFGHATEVKVFMDRGLLAFDELWAAGGRPDSVFPISPDDLAKASGAELVDISE